MPADIEFLTRVLPGQGPYFYATEKPTYTNKKSRFIQTSVDSLQSLISGTHNDDKNTYFATASYKSNKNRDADNVKLKKSFYIDVDIGPKKAYTDMPEAVAALKEFLRTTKLPLPTTIISSGGGMHLYWILDTPINTDQWLRVATALKNACIAEAFAADHVCTTDPTRVMRVPGTNNVKEQGNPRACKIIRMEAQDTTLPVISKAVAKYASTQLAQVPGLSGIEIAPGIPSVNEDDLGVAPEYPKAFAKYMIPECMAMSAMAASGGAEVSEPGWMHALGLLAYCEDGAEYIHRISEGHATYSKQRTELKFQKRLAVKETGKYGPPLCKTLAQESPGACAQCPHNTRINTPLTLGKMPDDGSIAPFPYFQDGFNMMKHSPEEGAPPIEICNFAVKDLALIKDEIGYALSFTAVTEAGERDVTLLMEMMNDSRALFKAVAKAYVIVQADQALRFLKFMTTWAQKLQSAARISNGHTRFGWVQDGDNWGFVTGSNTYWSHQVPTKSLMRNVTLKKGYTTKGSLSNWKAAAAIAAKANEPGLQMVLASGFAAPLMNFTPQAGGILSAASSKSGTGKTTTARISQSIWGDPLSGLNSIDDTGNALLRRAGLVGDLPVYMDELRGDKVPDFVKNVIFRVTQGKEKARLRDSADFQTMGTWNTLMTVTTNEKLLDHIEQHIHASDAGHRRILEFTVGQNPHFKSSDSYILDSVGKNYGHAGEIYAQFLANNRDKVEAMVEKADLMFKKATGNAVDTRFWTAISAALYVGAMLAKHLELVPFDIAGIKDTLLTKLGTSNQHATTVSQAGSGATAKDIVSEFLSVYAKSVIDCDVMPTGNNSPVYDYFLGDPRYLQLPVAAIRSETGLVAIPTSVIRHFVQQRRYMWGEFREAINNTKKGSTVARYPVDEAYGGSTIDVECIQFDLNELKSL